MTGVAFRKWFGNSKVVDEHGEPLVVYHGTTADFNVFDFNAGINAPVPQAVYFTDSLDLATYVSRMGWSRPGHVVAAYLRMTNPLVLDAEGAHAIAMTGEVMRRLRPRYRADAYDGVILLNVREFQQDALTTTYAVFAPNQIKSATANVGTFDRSSPDITKNPSGRGGTGRRARLKIEFLDRSASSTLAAPTIHNPPIDLRSYTTEPHPYANRAFYHIIGARSPKHRDKSARNAYAREVLARRGYVTGKSLGSGEFATTYALMSHPHRVAKVTNDPVDAAVMAELIHAPKSVDGIPKVYEVFQLGREFEGNPSWVVIVEKMFPLSYAEMMAFRDITIEYGRGWKVATGDLAGLSAPSHPSGRALVQAVMYLRSLGYLIADVHQKNMMRRRDGSYAISDFGMSGVTRERPMSQDVPIINPRDLKGRSIPERYLAGLPREAKRRRTLELTISRDAYRLGDFSELPTDRLARSMGLVKQSAYSKVAERRGIEWRGDADDMARRVCGYYGVRCTPAVATAITSSFNKGLAAWKSGGHRPGATGHNWAVARVASLVVGGKTSVSADRKEFASFPAPLRTAILAQIDKVVAALRSTRTCRDPLMCTVG